MVTAAGLLLAASFQLPRALRARFGNPAAPAHSYYRPGVPYEAFSYTPQTVSAEQQPNTSEETLTQTAKSATPPRMIHLGKIALAALNRPDNSQGSSSNQSTSFVRMTQSLTPNN